MSLVAKFRSTKNHTPEDVRRYAELLERDDEKTLPELIKLAHALDKTGDEVEGDRRIIQKAKDLSAQIKFGRGSQSAVDAIHLEISGHDRDTREMINARKAQAQPLHDRRAELLTAYNAARDAIVELRKLSEDHKYLLHGFVIPTEAELQ